MNLEHPRDLCRKLAIHFNLQTLRQRREIYDLTKNTTGKSMIALTNLARDLQAMIEYLDRFDAQLEHYRDSVFRLEFEHLAQRAEDIRRLPEDYAAMDRMDRAAADRWFVNSLAAGFSARKRRERAWDEPGAHRMED